MERRNHHRHRTIYRPAYISTGTGLHYAVMRNVSSDGASFSGLEGLSSGDEIIYFVGNSGPINAVVRWSDGDLFGVQNLFAADGLTVANLNFPYRSVRIPIVTETRLYSRGSATSVTLYNFSQNGACVVCPIELKLGELVTLELVGLTIEAAEIKWIEGRQAGLKFAKALDQRTMRIALDRLQSRSATGDVLTRNSGNRSVRPMAAIKRGS